ncbi:hypothetical protein GF356_08585 [candidate division GN15 bacterium]|nr:hypothetical protein [candidate division GN15 bacterium]
MDDILTQQPSASGEITSIDGKVAFVNWPVNWGIQDDRAIHADLVDGTDISGCRLVLFDPLQFALDHEFWSDPNNIADAVYTPMTEKQFKAYLKAVKRAQGQWQMLLERGGTLVIRARVPNAHIKLSRKKGKSPGTFTDGLVSTFFWLEELVDGLSFRYCSHDHLKFHTRTNPILRFLGESPVRVRQCLATVGRGSIQTIATSGPGFASPAITRVHFGEGRGQIFFIPEFHVPQEHIRLVEAFKLISGTGSSSLVRPPWLDPFERQLIDHSPYPEQLVTLDRQLRALERERQDTAQKQEEVLLLPEILYESGRSLFQAVYSSFELLGFQPSQLTTGEHTIAWQTETDKGGIQRVVVRTAASDDHAIDATETSRLHSAIQSCSLKIKPKGILVGNARRKLHPRKRTEWFDTAALAAAEQYEICLLSTYELFDIVCYLLRQYNRNNFEEIRGSLRTDLLESTGVFTMNTRKYLA